MKNLIIYLALSLSLNSAHGQLFGTGKVISKEYDFKNFEKLSILDFDGIIEVEIGKPYEIKVEIDENLGPRLRVINDENEKQLNIYLEGNKNGRLYLERTRIKIKVSMPSIVMFKHRGNTSVIMKGIEERHLRIENSGNGNVFLNGKADNLDINKNGNGDINAEKLISKVAKVKSYGNGNVKVNSQISLEGFGTGNGSIMQAGQGKIEPTSGVIGNGAVRKLKIL